MSDHDFQAERVNLQQEIKMFNEIAVKSPEDDVKFSSKSVQNTN